MPGSTYLKMVPHNITRDSATGNCELWLILAIEINLVSSELSFLPFSLAGLIKLLKSQRFTNDSVVDLAHVDRIKIRHPGKDRIRFRFRLWLSIQLAKQKLAALTKNM
jgi:hypothetical protein